MASTWKSVVLLNSEIALDVKNAGLDVNHVISKGVSIIIVNTCHLQVKGYYFVFPVITFVFMSGFFVKE